MAERGKGKRGALLLFLRVCPRDTETRVLPEPVRPTRRRIRPGGKGRKGRGGGGQRVRLIVYSMLSNRRPVAEVELETRSIVWRGVGEEGERKGGLRRVI